MKPLVIGVGFSRLLRSVSLVRRWPSVFAGEAGVPDCHSVVNSAESSCTWSLQLLSHVASSVRLVISSVCVSVRYCYCRARVWSIVLPGTTSWRVFTFSYPQRNLFSLRFTVNNSDYMTIGITPLKCVVDVWYHGERGGVVWHPGTLTLSPERQSAQMSKITNDGLTRSATGCFIAVPIWQQWAFKS